MSYDAPGAHHSSSGHDRGTGGWRASVPWELLVLGAALVLAPAVAAAAMAGGASPAAAAVIMLMVIAAGACASRLSAARQPAASGPPPGSPPESPTGSPTGPSTGSPTARGTTWPPRPRRSSASGEPLKPVERQLSLRYGVAVEQVAGHVWSVDGELVEATLDPATGRLMTGSSELSLRRHRRT